MILHGTLLTPVGQPMINSQVRLIAATTSPSVLGSISASFTTDDKGEYSFDCPIGRYRVQAAGTLGMRDIGMITITADTVVDNINQLLMIESTASSNDPILDQLGQIITEMGTAVQPEDLAVVATTGAYADLTGKPAIPATAGDIGAATSEQGDKADTAVQQVSGKGLSSNDYTQNEKDKLAGIADGATANPNTTSLTEGTNLYFTAARVLGAIASGLSLATSTAVTAADSIIVAIGKLQAQVSLKLAISSAFTNALTSGTNASSTLDVAVTPTSNSTQVVIGARTQLNFNSAFNMMPGGYLVVRQDVVNTSNTGTHDKIVARMAQLNLTGGNVSAAVGWEAVISQIGATTMIAGAAGFLFANHRGVPNIGNVSTLAAFSNQDPVALMVSAGPYVNADLKEIAPSRSAGLVPGRYYSAPLKSMTSNIVATSVIYVTYVYVPRRCVMSGLGFNVTTAAAGNGRLGLYKVANNTVTTLVVQTGDISTATTGAKEGTISTQIDSGVYALVAEFSGTPSIGWHEINTHDMIGASSATGFSEQAYITPFAYGALPATANILPTFAANTIEPHLFFRVSA